MMLTPYCGPVGWASRATSACITEASHMQTPRVRYCPTASAAGAPPCSCALTCSSKAHKLECQRMLSVVEWFWEAVVPNGDHDVQGPDRTRGPTEG